MTVIIVKLWNHGKLISQLTKYMKNCCTVNNSERKLKLSTD
jgi:hypothetical protein